MHFITETIIPANTKHLHNIYTTSAKRWSNIVQMFCVYWVAPVAETGFSHGFTAYKIVGHFFGLSYRKMSGSNQVKKNFFLESVTFQFHARMLSSEVAQSIKSYGHLLDLGIALSHRHVGFFG